MIDTGYTYKASPYSSHTLLVASLPAEGRGKRVLDIGCAGGYLAAILARRGYQVVGVERPAALFGCGTGTKESFRESERGFRKILSGRRT